MAGFQGRYGDAARLYAGAFAADRTLAEDFTTECRYCAACCAALAGCGLGTGGGGDCKGACDGTCQGECRGSCQVDANANVQCEGNCTGGWQRWTPKPRNGCTATLRGGSFALWRSGT